jgi:hypothetical protein
VTGKPVPDEAARVEVYRYINPKAAKWPKTDFIIGNPPFIGGKDIRDRLGSGYFDALFCTTDVPESADFVMHWWDMAAWAVRRGTRAFGFITTNSLPQTFSRRVVAKHLEAKNPVHLAFAIPNHPWVDASDGAAVRIAMTIARAGPGDGVLLTVANESQAPEVVTFAEAVVGRINSDLRVGADVASAIALKANDRLCSPGVKLHGDGFIVTPEVAASLSDLAPARIRSGAPGEQQVIFPYRNGRDLASRPRGVMVIDLYGLSEAEVRTQHPAVYQLILSTVKPHRDENNRASYRDNWWLYGEARSELRKALARVSRYIATIETAKHRLFQFLPVETVPDNMLVCAALDDAFFLGVMSSRFHMLWAVTAGGRMGMGDDPRYNKTRCFDPFPFPADVPEPLKGRIRVEAEALDALRKRVLAAHDDLTLTGLYNVFELLRAGTPLSDKDRAIHDRGLVTIIRQHHDAIDALVAEAYGWGADHAAGTLTDAEILNRLVALNAARAAEEARGIIRWLRPEYQAPNEAPRTTGNLDLGESAPLPASATIIPWPKTLPEQVSAVAGLLQGATTPLHPRDVARAFKAKQASSMTPVLDTLTAIGMARKLADGRYAA